MTIHCIDKIALIAGSGSLPRQVYDACVLHGIECEVIGLDASTSEELFHDVKHSVYQPHAVSKIINKIRLLGIKHVVFAGKVNRQNISKLLLDSKGAKLFAMILRKGLNDNSVLQTIIKFFEHEGFIVLAPEQIATEIVVSRGNITKVDIDKEAKDDIYKGFNILKGIAHFDVGQAIVIQNGLVLGVEAAEGTDDLIKRSGEIQQKNEKGAILIKACKPEQDRRIDLPCIGKHTIQYLADAGLRGVALEAGTSLILNPQETIESANEKGIFIYGI